MQGISMPYLLLTLAALFWGGNYVVGHILVQGADPILMTEARWALTALLLVVLYHRQIRESQQLLRQNGATLLVLTLWAGELSFNPLYWPAVDLRAECGDLHVSDPCMVLMINRLIFHDRVSARNWWGVIFSTAGVLLLLHGNLSNSGAKVLAMAICGRWDRR
jgi:drug/metabolite transporter (DMT)-like permease